MQRNSNRGQKVLGAFVAGFLAASLIVVPIYRARDRRSKARERAALAATIVCERAHRIDMLAQRDRIDALQRKLEDVDERLAYTMCRMYTLKDAAALGDDFSVRRLIHAGIDDDKHGALRLAVEHNRLSTVKILIKAGADAHLFDEEGWQGITDNRLIRIAAANGNVGIVRCLFDCGVKPRFHIL